MTKQRAIPHLPHRVVKLTGATLVDAHGVYGKPEVAYIISHHKTHTAAERAMERYLKIHAGMSRRQAHIVIDSGDA